MLGLKSSLRDLKCIGTDGEIAISRGFQLAFPDCKHILCFIHMKRNLTSKLRELGFNEADTKRFLNDIFGFQSGTHKVDGLVDAKTEAEFDQKLKDLKAIWCLQEPETRSLQFYNWFVSHHAKNVKEKMLLSLREHLGIGQNKYTTK